MDNTAAQEALSMLKSSKSFVLDQAPDLMKQILVYSYAKNIAALVFVAMLLIAAALLFPRIKESWEDVNGAPVIPVFGAVFITLAGISAVVVIPSAVTEMLQIHYAPKIFLLEYFAGLVK